MRDTKHLGKHANKLAEEAKEKALFVDKETANIHIGFSVMELE